jgi:hypothetical protein
MGKNGNLRPPFLRGFFMGRGRAEMWQCNDCGAMWSESKAVRCFNQKCMGKNIFIYWKPGQVKFRVEDYAVAKEMLPSKAKKKVKKIDKIVKTEVKSKPKSKLISHKQYSGKLTDLF